MAFLFYVLFGFPLFITGIYLYWSYRTNKDIQFIKERIDENKQIEILIKDGWWYDKVEEGCIPETIEIYPPKNLSQKFEKKVFVNPKVIKHYLEEMEKDVDGWKKLFETLRLVPNKALLSMRKKSAILWTENYNTIHLV